MWCRFAGSFAGSGEADQSLRRMPSNQTPPTLGLRHLALYVFGESFEATLRFYCEGMGMAIEWQPDSDNVYLSSGSDNLALHRCDRQPSKDGALDHLGFMMPDAEAVEAWFRRLSGMEKDLKIQLVTKPRLHRDGATSFYLLDPAGNRLQIVHVPNGKENRRREPRRGAQRRSGCEGTELPAETRVEGGA